MKRKLFNDWIAALRSDKFTQIRGKLAQHGSTGRCCLGVLCDVAGTEYDAKNGVQLPADFAENIGMKQDGRPLSDPTDVDNSLASLNDGSGSHFQMGFKTIADLLEANPLKYIRSIEED